MSESYEAGVSALRALRARLGADIERWGIRAGTPITELAEVDGLLIWLQERQAWQTSKGTPVLACVRSVAANLRLGLGAEWHIPEDRIRMAADQLEGLARELENDQAASSAGVCMNCQIDEHGSCREYGCTCCGPEAAPVATEGYCGGGICEYWGPVVNGLCPAHYAKWQQVQGADCGVTITPAPGGRPGGTVTSVEPAATMCQSCGRQPSVIVLDIGSYCLGCLGVLAMQLYGNHTRSIGQWQERALKAEGELSKLHASRAGGVDRDKLRRSLGRLGTVLGELRSL